MSRSSEEPTAIHEPPHVTLPPDLERELSSVTLSVFQKTLALAEPTTVDIVTQTIASVQRCVTAVLVPELRKRNARLASTANLPSEVLCMIWQLLCVEDRVKVSHVCSSWRSLAIDTPRLWAELDFSSVKHDDLCLCSFCRPRSSIVVPRPTNIGICSKVLHRSGSVPLIVQMNFTLNDTPVKDILGIAASLEPHCHRLEGLFFVVQLSDDVADFFSNLACPFPKLRTLHCTTSWKERRRIILPPLPNAETILMRRFALDCTALQLPSVRSLHCAVDDQNDVLRILDGCPKLETLALETQTFKLTASPTTLDSIRSRSSRLQKVVLLDVSCGREHNLLAMFHHATLRTLRINYFDDLPLDDLVIFHDLEATIDVVVSREAGGQHRISATDSSGRTRAVQSQYVGEVDMALAWEKLSHCSVTTLTLHAKIWPSIRPHVSVLPCVRTVTFLLDLLDKDAEAAYEDPYKRYPLSGDIMAGLSDEDVESVFGVPDLSESYPLPALEHLRLVCSKNRDYSLHRPLVPVTEVALLISSLKGPAALHTLTVDNIDLDGDREDLAELVRELVI